MSSSLKQKLISSIDADHTTVVKSEPPVSKKLNSIKDNCFSWIDKPFGHEQHVTNRVVLLYAHIGALYYCYIYHVAKKVNPASVFFGKILNFGI